MESHINTFENGMNKDFNILYQPNGTYRNMVNCQLISQDGNNFVIKDCLGNTRVFNINIPFLTFVSGTPPTVTYQPEPMIIAFISFPDRLMVLSTNDDTETGGYGEIGEIRFAPYGEGIQPINNNPVNTYKGYVPLYHHKDLNFTKLRRIEGFAFEENDTIKRIYWTDNLNEPRVFDVGNPIYSTFYADGALVVGQQYMVVEGAVTHNGIVYGPGLTYDPIGGNVFTAVNANYTDESASFVIAKVIKYYPYQLLSFTPSRALGNIKFKEYGSGSVYCGSKMYFYRLTDTANGIVTSWSYGCLPIAVETTNSVTALVGGNYFNFTGGGTTTTLLNSGKSVKITIDNIDTNFTNIEVAVAEFDQILDTPRLISIISNDIITSSSMTVEHTGSVNLGTLTLDDITLFPASILTCKTMTTNKNYALIANITERSEFSSFDNSGVTISQIQYKMPCHYADFGPASGAAVCDNILSYTNIGPLTNANPVLVDGIMPHTRWLVVSGGTVTYNAVTYAIGEVFTGVVGVFNWAVATGTPVLRPCTYKNKYTTNAGTGSLARPDVIQLTERLNNYAYWNYKDPAVSSHVKGYWNGEKYRFGILFFDLKGNPFYVRHLGDYTTSKQDTVAMMPFETVDSTGLAAYYTSQTGIKISGVTIPASIIDKISGFSIVRVERDATIMSQGLIMPVGAGGLNIIPLCAPEPFYQGSSYNSSIGTVFSYVCPDNLVSYPIQNYTVGSYLEPATWLEPQQHTDGVSTYYMKSSYDGYEVSETKYFIQNTAETTGPATRNYKISAIQDVSENQTLTNFGAGSYSFINRTAFVFASVTPIEPLCFGVTPPDMDSSTAIGGKRTVIEIETPNFYDYNSTVNLLSDLTVNGIRRPLTNLKVSKATLYGGDSEAALSNNLYISTGHFQPITSAFKTETIDVNGNYTVNDIEIFGGDAYTCIVDYGHSTQDTSIVAAVPFPTHGWGLKFPCQCNSNYDLRRGRTVANSRLSSVSPGICYNPARLESFEYNKGYSSDGKAINYPALPFNYNASQIFKYRIRFAGVKFPGELVNSFRTFLTNDYKDTDGQGGEINNLKTKNGRSIVWQNKIISTVPILERQLLGSGNGASTVIGTGGVVDRFDPINDYFGNQHQWGLTETEYGFAWFDMRRKAFVVLDLNSGVTEVSKIDGMKSFFDEIFVDNLGSTIQSFPLNSPTFDKTSDRPLVGVGITGVYDPKLKMTYLTFKWRVYSSLGDFPKYTTKNFTIGYYHLGKQFIGFYDMNGAIYHNHNQTVFAVNDPKSKTKFYGPGMASTAFVVGETVMVGSVEYVCITNVTVASYPGTTSGTSGTNPTTGTDNWTLMNKTNEVYVHNQPVSLNQSTAPDYQYNKFFGLVVNNEIEFIVNPKTENPFSALNREEKGNNVKYTDVYIEADSVTASDTSIGATSRFFKYIYDRITASYPLSSTGRITNSYLKVKFVKKNWTTNPVTLTGATKILQWVKTFFEQKR